MKILLPFAIILILGTPFLSCTPQDMPGLSQNNNSSQVVSTGDDDDIGPDNDKDEDED
jgi:hypothetical protein